MSNSLICPVFFAYHVPLAIRMGVNRMASDWRLGLQHQTSRSRTWLFLILTWRHGQEALNMLRTGKFPGARVLVWARSPAERGPFI